MHLVGWFIWMYDDTRTWKPKMEGRLWMFVCGTGHAINPISIVIIIIIIIIIIIYAH
jgi:hypothetical protein